MRRTFFLWAFLRSIDPAARVLMATFTLLGVVALWWILRPPTQAWYQALFFWRPTLLYWALALSLVIPPWLRWGYPVKYILGPHLHLAEKEWLWLCRIFALAYLFLGSVNLAFAYRTSSGDWIDFKDACMMNLLFLILLRINFVWLGILKNVVMLIYGVYKQVTLRLQGKVP